MGSSNSKTSGSIVSARTGTRCCYRRRDGRDGMALSALINPQPLPDISTPLARVVLALTQYLNRRFQITFSSTVSVFQRLKC
ncbi:hypothetical protein KCP75_12220 [Salmonella enterica subsp. enterica]|nr:hypothetical protein KCP75_12220 [Salmonella enterica subsp. enterica]